MHIVEISVASLHFLIFSHTTYLCKYCFTTCCQSINDRMPHKIDQLQERTVVEEYRITFIVINVLRYDKYNV